MMNDGKGTNSVFNFPCKVIYLGNEGTQEASARMAAASTCGAARLESIATMYVHGHGCHTPQWFTARAQAGFEVSNNTVFTKTGSLRVCGKDFAQYGEKRGRVKRMRLNLLDVVSLSLRTPRVGVSYAQISKRSN